MYPTGRRDDQFQKEVGRWWVHNLTRSCTSSSERNRCPWMFFFFRSPKCVSHKAKDLGSTEDVEVFPSQISEAYLSPDWQYGDGRYRAKGWFRPTAFQTFWLYCPSHHPQPPRYEPHLTVLLFLPPFPMLDEHTLHYTHLQSNEEKTVWSCAFSLCMSPNLQMAVSIRNNTITSFCEESVLWRVFGLYLTAPYRYDVFFFQLHKFLF